jgi:hypothetical protein
VAGCVTSPSSHGSSGSGLVGAEVVLGPERRRGSRLTVADRACPLDSPPRRSTGCRTRMRAQRACDDHALRAHTDPV